MRENVWSEWQAEPFAGTTPGGELYRGLEGAAALYLQIGKYCLVFHLPLHYYTNIVTILIPSKSSPQ